MKEIVWTPNKNFLKGRPKGSTKHLGHFIIVYGDGNRYCANHAEWLKKYES